MHPPADHLGRQRRFETSMAVVRARGSAGLIGRARHIVVYAASASRSMFSSLSQSTIWFQLGTAGDAPRSATQWPRRYAAVSTIPNAASAITTAVAQPR